MEANEQSTCAVLALVDYESDGGMGKSLCVSPVLQRFICCFKQAQWSSDEVRANGLRRLAIAQVGTAGTLDERLFAEKLRAASFNKLLAAVVKTVGNLLKDPHRSKLLQAASCCETDATFAAAKMAACALTEAAHAAAGAYAQLAAAVSPFEMAARAADGAAARAGYAAANRAADAAAARSPAKIAAHVATVAVDGADSVARAAYAAFAAGSLGDGRQWGPADIMALVTGAADRLLSDFAEDVVEILIAMKTPGSAILALTQ